MHFLVTGGLGYIGAHTVIQLYNSGHTATIIDDCRNSNEKTVEFLTHIVGKQIIFHKIDITNKTELFNCIKDLENIVDFIIHFAALKNVGESTRIPLEYYQNNLTGLLNILDLAKAINCPNFIFSSSCTVYPHNAAKPLTEMVRAAPSSTSYDTIATCQNPYGTSKLICEQILHDISAADKFWNITILRYFNPVGNHSSGLIGDNFKDNSKSMNLFTAILNNKFNNKPVQVFGNTYPTNDGTAIRDYIHVIDLADAHILAAEWSINNKGLEVFNIGTGKGYSVLEILNKFISKGFSIQYNIVEARKGDIDEVYADITKTKNILKWESKYSLDRMVEDTISFFNKNI